MKKKRHMTYDTDRIMMEVWRSLVRDFSATQPIARAQVNSLRLGGVSRVRTDGYPDYSTTSPYRFKQWAQLEHFWKRYIFRRDVHDTADLECMAEQKFAATQMRLAEFREYSPGIKYYLRKTRQFVGEILGKYDPQEHFDACRFSRNAVVGTPLAQAYLDVKLSKSLTGSHGHIEWFRRHYLEQDHMLKVALSKCIPEGMPRYAECTTLSLTTVPKSWKAYRTITPNTLIGSFHSHGLGKVIEKRLRSVRLDIRHLQHRHGVLAEKFSVSRSHVTADLSAASDSFTSQLVGTIVPRPWLQQLKLGRIPYCKVPSGATIWMSSFMAMGIGFTFPLQTLLFYCLLETLRRLRRVKGFVSVFGDDLIYPRALHADVAKVFPQLGFQLNLDKTFCNSHFRESCGSDFYMGIDVRPYMPEGVGALLSKTKYESFLYKLINGLRRRWDDAEISSTIHLLLKEVAVCAGRVLQVPPDFPDISGVKVDKPVTDWILPWVSPKWDALNSTYVFPYLRQCCDKRIVSSLVPFSWDWHRQKLTGEDDTDFWFPDPFDVNTPSLCWIKTQPPKYTRSKITGQRLRRMLAAVNDRQLIRLVRQDGSTTCWI